MLYNKTNEITINIIQDLATPHNNNLIKELIKDSKIKLNVWYASNRDLNRYNWENDITNEHINAKIYGTTFNLKFIKYCLSHPDEKYFIVGWMNINTVLLHIFFYLLNRPYNHWTDCPNPTINRNNVIKNLFRLFAYKILRYSNSKIFTVGLTAMNYFLKLGFPKNKLINLPIFVQIPENLEDYKCYRDKIFTKLNIDNNKFLVSAGSRLIYEKGYDLLITAISLIDSNILKHIKVLIVGQGECKASLQKLINDLNLTDHISLKDWLDFQDFQLLIANSDVFIHPSRFDAYGGTIIGMSLGVPVIGSTRAGAAIDRIEHGINGFLYDTEDIKALSTYISLLYENHLIKKKMSQEAFKTANIWHAKIGVDIIFNNII